MSQSLQIERPAARAFTLPTSFAVPRATTPRILATARPVEPTPAAMGDPAAASTDHLIKSIELAAKRMGELVEEQRAHDRVVAGLQAQLAEMARDKEAADQAARTHEARADEALREADRLRGQWQSQCDEQERLKASVKALVAMFGAPEAMPRA